VKPSAAPLRQCGSEIVRQLLDQISSLAAQQKASHAAERIWRRAAPWNDGRSPPGFSG